MLVLIQFTINFFWGKHPNTFDKMCYGMMKKTKTSLQWFQIFFTQRKKQQQHFTKRKSHLEWKRMLTPSWSGPFLSFCSKVLTQDYKMVCTLLKPLYTVLSNLASVYISVVQYKKQLQELMIAPSQFIFLPIHVLVSLPHIYNNIPFYLHFIPLNRKHCTNIMKSLSMNLFFSGVFHQLWS